MVRFLVAAVILLAADVHAVAQEVQEEELRFLILEAFARNPAIEAEVLKMRAAEERIPQAGALDDPSLTFKVEEFPDARGGQAKYYSFDLMQMITFPTKLGTRRDIAAIQAEHAYHEYLEKVLVVIAQLKSAYAMLWGARNNLDLNLRNQKLLEQIVEAAQTLYSVGKVPQQDVLKASIELSKVKNEEASLRQEMIAAEAMLRALLNREESSPIGFIALGSLQTVQHSENDLQRFARHNRPMLVHDSLSVLEADLMLRLNRQEYLPNFTVGIERMTMPGSGMGNWAVSAGISLPFAPWTLNKASARVQEAQARRGVMESMFASTRTMIAARVREAYAAVKAWERRASSYEMDILPKTERSLRLLMTEYQTGVTSYLMLIDGFRIYQEMAMDNIMARVRYEQAVAALEREVGVTDLSVIPKEQ